MAIIYFFTKYFVCILKKMFINMNVMLKLLLKRCKYTGKNEKQLFLWVFVTMIILVLSSIANDDLVNIHL